MLFATLHQRSDCEYAWSIWCAYNPHLCIQHKKITLTLNQTCCTYSRASCIITSPGAIPGIPGGYGHSSSSALHMHDCIINKTCLKILHKILLPLWAVNSYLLLSISCMKQGLHTVLTTYENYFFAAQICLSFSIIAMELKSHIFIFCGSAPHAIAVQQCRWSRSIAWKVHESNSLCL